MRYVVTDASGARLEVEAVDWMMAMGRAIDRWGLEVSGWMCETLPDGEVQVMDPPTGRTWSVAPADSEAAQEASGPARVGASSLPATPPAPDPAPARPPALSAPQPSLGREPTGPPEDLAEQLFERGMEISAAPDRNNACSEALRIVLDLVPCEAGSVLRGTLNDDALKFVAVSGPAAQQLIGQKVPFGKGLVGACYDRGITIQVRDVRHDDRHLADFDDATGFVTRAALCVPVHSEGVIYGVMELLNPPQRFADWHVEVARSIALSLGTTLAAIQA